MHFSRTYILCAHYYVRRLKFEESKRAIKLSVKKWSFLWSLTDSKLLQLSLLSRGLHFYLSDEFWSRTKWSWEKIQKRLRISMAFYYTRNVKNKKAAQSLRRKSPHTMRSAQIIIMVECAHSPPFLFHSRLVRKASLVASVFTAIIKSTLAFTTKMRRAAGFSYLRRNFNHV